ncbi:unnamed protein product, partial [Symbiodinium necroappetens]
DWGRGLPSSASGSFAPQPVMNHSMTITLVQDCFSQKSLACRLVPIEENPLVQQLPKSVQDPVGADITDIPDAVANIQVDFWAEGRPTRATARALGEVLLSRLQRKSCGQLPATSVDVLVTGCEVSLWVGEQFAADLRIAPEDPPIHSQIAPADPPVQSQLNPDAPEFDFAGVSGETQFGSESYVYLPLPEYTVQEWCDYLYYLQANRVLLTPEYAAYICELTRLLGMPMMEYLDWSAANPEANFKKAEGKGFSQLKCDTQPKDQGCLPCRFGFSVSNEEMRIASSHFTESKCIVELPDAMFHVFGATGRDQLVEVTALIEL